MEIEYGSIVFSKAGRDRGRPMVAVGTSGGYLLLCDGKERRLSKPKLKNPKHIAATKEVISGNSMATDRGLRKALLGFEERNKTKEG